MLHSNLFNITGLEGHQVHRTTHALPTNRFFPNSIPLIKKKWKCCSPVEGHVGVKNGSSHCFGASVVADCTQADSARLTAQTAALLLHIGLHLQPGNT